MKGKKLERYKQLFEKEIFTEMSKIRDIKSPIITCGIYVNEKGENREDPHWHIRMPNETEHRIRMKDFSDMDILKKSKKDTLSSKQIKKLKEILLSPDEDDPSVSSLQASLIVWNKQEGNKHKVKMFI